MFLFFIRYNPKSLKLCINNAKNFYNCLTQGTYLTTIPIPSIYNLYWKCGKGSKNLKI